MVIKEYKKHEQVPKQYRWDIDALLQNYTIEQLIEQVLQGYRKLIETKDTKYLSGAAYLQALKTEDELSELMNKVHNYISNKISQNVVDAVMIELSQKFNYEIYKLQQEMGSEESRFFKHIDKIREWAQKPEFADFKHYLVSHLECEKHRLSEEIEEFRLQEERADISASEVFEILTNAELKFRKAIDSKGKQIVVNESNRSVLAKHRDFNVRKSASLSYRQAYLDHKGTLSNLLFQHFKHIATWAKIKKFSSSVTALTFSDRVDKNVLETLYNAVQKNITIFKKVHRYHGIFYQKKFDKKMTKYDLEVELIKKSSHYTIEEAQKLVINSIKPFGQEYTHVVQKALLEEQWVDYMPVQNKRKGAYSIGGSFGIAKKYILMNFDGTLRAVETLAHEMGHSMHSYFSDQNNNLRNSQYPIFLAEIASIFNELMLFDYLLNTTNSDQIKFDIYQKMIFGFMATVVRQTEWSNYEYDLYNLIDQGQPVATYEAISQVYYKNSLKYNYSKVQKFKAENQYPAIFVPHFYYHFYVYKYAIGQICANIFYRKYQLEGQQALETYIKQFLSVGGRDFPLKILLDAGIDLTKVETYQLGFDFVSELIEKWITLGKKIFKVK